MDKTKCIMITASGTEGRFTDTVQEAKAFFEHAIECEASSVWVCKGLHIVCEIPSDQLKNSRDLLAAYCPQAAKQPRTRGRSPQDPKSATQTRTGGQGPRDPEADA